MLKIEIPKRDFWDASKKEFIYIDATSISLEHSLVSISKWESKWHKPFYSKDKKTSEELIDYIKCMTISQNVDPLVYMALPESAINKIVEYMKDPMTATTVKELSNTPGSNKVLTSEVIYYYMIAFNIPFECQKWHINRLMTLIKVCNAKNTPPKKMGKAEALRRRNATNEARRQKLGTTG